MAETRKIAAILAADGRSVTIVHSKTFLLFRTRLPKAS